MLALALMFYNLLQTASRRKEKLLYVSVWYVFGALIFTFFIYFFGNAMWNPRTGAIIGNSGCHPCLVLRPRRGGPLPDASCQLPSPTTSFPSRCRSPLYSHTLSLVGFWTILMIYTHIGTHHLLQTPVPTWLKVLAISGSMAMLIPVSTVLINLWLTMRGGLGISTPTSGENSSWRDSSGTCLTCIQGPLQALPAVQKVTHLNNWVVAHAHLGVLGFSGTIALGGIYFILPAHDGKADLQHAPGRRPVLAGACSAWPDSSRCSPRRDSSRATAWLNGETVYRILPANSMSTWLCARPSGSFSLERCLDRTLQYFHEPLRTDAPMRETP